MVAKIESLPVTKRVGVWLRVSTEEQAGGESPKHHEHRARAYAEAKGWEIVTIYHLEGVSGKAVSGHREAKRMMEDVREGRISGLIFSKLARLARNTKELLAFADYFREYDADLVSLQESIDTSTPSGRLFYTMFAAMAEWERDEIVERISATVPVRARLGKSLGGDAPFGYEWIDNKLEPQPDEAVLRRRIFELFAEHKRKKVVAKLLNEAGHRTRTGGQWTDTSIHRILRDPIVIGKRRVNYNRHTGPTRQSKNKPASEWLYQSVEPILSEELWATCQHILGEPQRRGTRQTKTPVHLFAGFVQCACGKKMYVPSNAPKYVCQACRTKIPIQDLEGIFYDQLQHVTLSPTEVTEFLTRADQAIAGKQAELDLLMKDHTRVKSQMDQTYNLYLDRQISTSGFGERYRPLEERLAQLDEEIPRLQGEIDVLKINYLSSDQILNEAHNLYLRWPDLTFPDKRKIVENIVDRITIDPEEIRIDLCYLPPALTSSEIMAKEHQSL